MSASPTLILSREDIVRTVSLADYVVAVERAFAQAAGGLMSVPDVVHITAPGGAFHVKSAGFSEAPGYIAVKVNGNFPDNPARNGLPTIQGVIVLCDGRDGRVLALLDSAEITAMRTAAATAVAARYLAPRDATVVTLIGCGVQGPLQLLALREFLPLENAYLYDTNPQRAADTARQLADRAGLTAVALDDFADGTRVSQVIVTCTSSRRAFLRADHVRPGTFIAAVGADNDDKQELDPDLMASSKVFVDVLNQCLRIGELHHAVAARKMNATDVVAELGEVVAGRVLPALDRADITVFDSTGTAVQDVAAAGLIYERALANGLGVSKVLS